MSAKGNPYDNAFVESFFKTLKQEEVTFLFGLSASRGIREVVGKERLSGMHGVLRLKVSSLRGSLQFLLLNIIITL